MTSHGDAGAAAAEDEGDRSREDDRQGSSSTVDGRVIPVEGVVSVPGRPGVWSKGVGCVGVGVAGRLASV